MHTEEVSVRIFTEGKNKFKRTQKKIWKMFIPGAKNSRLEEMVKKEILEEYQDPDNGGIRLSTTVNWEKRDGIYLSLKIRLFIWL